MERCPNCGATVRAGAKFCTTCGMRLPDLPAAESPSPTATANRSPFESTSSVTSTRWPAERTSQATSGDATAGYAVASGGGQAAETADQAPVGASEPAEFAEPVDTSPLSSEESSGEAAPGGTPVWPPLGRPSSWDNSWRSPAPPEAVEDTPLEAKSAEIPAAVAAPDEDESEEPRITGTETGRETPMDAGIVEAEAEAEEVAVAEEVEQVAAAAELEPEPQLEPESAAEIEPEPEPAQQAEPLEIQEEPLVAVPEVPEQHPGPTDLVETTATGAGIERAYALLDELRGVVAGLSGDTGQQIAAAAVAEDLTAARSNASDDEFGRLRAAISSARERPRDIDTMLDVSGRLDAITALHDAYQRLASAVDGAVESLRASSDRGSTDE
ncbi:MAG: zinc-ribbon domain-containing protein [Thermomicrobiales bacterium]